MANAMEIPDQNITIIRDQQATKRNILQALEAFSKKAADGGRVFIYFSGHGTRYYNPFINSCVEGLLTYDYETISNSEMAKATKALNSSVDKSILLIDACHSQGVLNNNKSRSLFKSNYVAKFASKDKSGAEVCTPVNFKTRSLFDESQTLGAIKENIVYIASARPDEVSWDQAGKGGVATQALRECLLGRARDLDQSGAVSLEEVRQCAQNIMDEKMPGPDQIASHITVYGNRNLIPVKNNLANNNINEPAPQKIQTTQLQTTQLQTTTTTIAPVTPIIPISPGITKPPADYTTNNSQKPIQVAINDRPEKISPPSKPIETKPITEINKPTPTQPNAPLPNAQPEKVIQSASIATLNDVLNQANPQRNISVTVDKKNLKINKDYLSLQVKSNTDGYLYMVLLGSDKKSFYLLYPNHFSQNNFIKAGQLIKIPEESWQIKAGGPVGVDNILILVADSQRDLTRLGAFGSETASPFVYALNNIEGRGNLIDFLTGKSTREQSEKFGATLVSIKETN
jgi:hypothetical protein